MEERDSAVSIDLIQIAKAMFLRWWIVAITAIVGAVIAFSYTYFFVTPMYTSSAMLYVNASSASSISSAVSKLTSTDISTAKSLVKTYQVILKTRLTLEEVADKLKDRYSYNLSYGALSGMISTAAVQDTEIFRVTVTDSNPVRAANIANMIVEVLPEKISNVMVGSSVRTVDLAVRPSSHSSPSYSKNTLLGFAIGALLGAVILFCKEYFNDAVQSESWVRDIFGEAMPVLTVIPDVDAKTNTKYGKYYSRYGYGYGYEYGYGYGNNVSKSNMNENKEEKKTGDADNE